MSATVAAALKKIAVSLLSDKKVIKTIGGIIIGALLIICLPVMAIVCIFNGDIKIDPARFQQIVEANMSSEQVQKLQKLENTMYAIEDAMTAEGFDDLRVKEAQVLYVLALPDCSEESNFVAKLTGCFTRDQSDEQLIAAINSTFGKSIPFEEFTQVMAAIRANYISITGYVDPYTKNNFDLVEWAKQALSKGWGYVCGTYGEVLNKPLYKAKLEQYPDQIEQYSEFIESHWLGGRTADCIGFIKGYSWLNPDTRKIEYAVNGMPDIDQDVMFRNATVKGTIDTIPEIPGLAVWHEGHIGIYIGDGQVIHASGTMVGVVQTPIAGSGWTHWLKIPYITYIESNVPTAVNERRIWDALYEKIGNPYGVAGLMGNLFAESGLHPNNLQDTYEGRLGFSDTSYTEAVDSGSYTNFKTDSAGYGLAQWTVEIRKTRLLNFANSRGTSISDLDMQLDFLCQELETGFPGVFNALKNATSVREASDYVLVHFEAPLHQEESIKAGRASYGAAYYIRYGH